MVMVAVPVPGPPQVPGAVGQTSAAPDSWMVKVAVFSSARAPLAAMTAPTEDRTTVRTAMLTSRLPIEPPFLWPDAGIRLLPPETAVAAGWLRSLPDTAGAAWNATWQPSGQLQRQGKNLTQDAMIPQRRSGLLPTARR